MRLRLMALGVSLAAAPWLAAQVSVEVVLDQEQFLVAESIPVAVRITNFSGQTLHLGQEPDWLSFTIEAREGYLVPPLGEVPVREAFDLENSTVATKRVDLGPCFRPPKPGRYLLTATVKIPQWERTLQSRPKEFDVIVGTILWQQAFGLPPQAGNSRAPEVRRYALQQAIHLRQMKLYVRVTDQTGEQVLRLFPLGPLVSFSDPEKQIDKESNLHVLFQSGARNFSYSVVDPEGRWLLRQTYEYTRSRPVLRADGEGKITVSGGLRRPSRDDLPPATTTAVPTNNAAAP
jgi:hypothetical protein